MPKARLRFSGGPTLPSVARMMPKLVPPIAMPISMPAVTDSCRPVSDQAMPTKPATYSTAPSSRVRSEP